MKLAQGSDPNVKIPPPDARRCAVCGQLVGNLIRVHYASVKDARPCPGSWM